MNNQKLLNDIISELKRLKMESEIVKEYQGKLVDIYKNGFRHSYSEISFVLITGQDDELDAIADNVNTILKSIRLSYDCRSGEIPEEIKISIKGIEKLYDHIKLELIRLRNFSKTMDLENTKSEINNVEKKTKAVSNNINNVEKKYKDIEEKLNKNIVDMITVVGIFSAIIMSVFGGMAFIGNALSAISSISKFRLIFIILLAGLFLINIIFTLMYFISKLSRLNIYSVCTLNKKNNECYSNSCKNFKCNFLQRVKNRLPYIFYINLLFLTMMVAVFLLWILNRYVAWF